MNAIRILIAMDGTDASSSAAAAARQLFGNDNVEYLAINVVRPIVVAGASEVGFGAVYPMGVEDSRVGMADADVRAAARAAGIDDAEVLAEVGEPASAIIEAAATHGVDVIVVGAGHRGFFSRLFEPSVSEGVTRRATVPVLVVPEPEPPS